MTHDEPLRQTGSKTTHCLAARSSGGVSPPFCMPTMPMPGTFTSLGLTPRPTLPKLVPPLNALKPDRAYRFQWMRYMGDVSYKTHHAHSRASGGQTRYLGPGA